MKQLVSIPVNGYLFWRISRTATLKHRIGQYGRYFSAVKAVPEIHKDVFTKPVLDSKKRKNVHLGRRLSTKAEESVDLMDFDVWMHPKFLQSFRDFYYINFVLNKLDNFSITEFINCSGEALRVVTNLLSELRFPELQGLLTPECKEQIEKNLGSWSKEDAAVLSFERENLMRSIPCDVQVFPDTNNEEKQFVEIRVIHYVWLKYSSKFGRKERSALLDKLNERSPTEGKIHMGAVYNCKFIREITNGVDDQWTMNKINLKCFPDVYFKF